MSQNAAWVLYCWLWCKPAVVAPIQPLAWELPNAPKKQKTKNKKRKNPKTGIGENGVKLENGGEKNDAVAMGNFGSFSKS